MIGTLKRRMFDRHRPAAERMLGVTTLQYWGGAFLVLLLWLLAFGVVGQLLNGYDFARASIDKDYQAEVINRIKPMRGLEVVEVRADPPEDATSNLDRALNEHKREVSRPAQPKPQPKPPETLDSHLRENYPLQMQAFDEMETRLKTAKAAEERALIEKIYILKSDFVFNMERAQHYKSAVERYQNKPDLWRDAIARNQAKFSEHDSKAKQLRRQILDLEKQLSDLQAREQQKPAISLQLSPEDAAKFKQSLNQ